MANMSYCRFENTSSDLSDCLDAVENINRVEDFEEMSDYEREALRDLLETCEAIAHISDRVGLVGLLDRADEISQRFEEEDE
tara:strand:- start:63 stop:308 length:246 start_codon:yes stop_codon:yes gene_type:complete